MNDHSDVLALSSSEARLVALYRAMDSTGKGLALPVLDILARHNPRVAKPALSLVRERR